MEISLAIFFSNHHQHHNNNDTHTWPSGCKVYLNKPQHYHVTVYMTSQPYDLRPDPYHAPDGRWDPAVTPVPTQHVIDSEHRDVAALAAASPAPELEVYRIVLTNTGTLLLCCTEAAGHVARLRQGFVRRFPGGPVKQSTILHISLLRCAWPPDYLCGVGCGVNIVPALAQTTQDPDANSTGCRHAAGAAGRD